MPQDSLMIVWTTAPKGEPAQALARSLVEAGLAACASVSAPARSVYRWQGAVEEAEEELLWLKVPASRAERLMQAVRERHPYAVPEIAAIHLDHVLPEYLAWALESTRPES